MEVNSIKSSVGKFQNNSLSLTRKLNKFDCVGKTYRFSTNNKAKNSVSFGAISGKLLLKNLTGYMSNIDETKNALITMIGTGLIAPFAIMCSPKKPCRNPGPSDDKKDREKKLFQAIRQPISAVLAFGFQMVSIFGINKLLNYGAYKANWGMFKDEGLNNLIPDESYLRKEAAKILKGKVDPELSAQWAEEIKLVQNEEQMKNELKNKIRAEYDDVGIVIDETTLEKKASKKSALQNFRIEKMAESKQKKLQAAKIQELLPNPPKDINIELVTEEYQKQVKELFGPELKNLDKNANLKWYDKLLNYFGIKTKKIKALDAEKDQFVQTKGLDLVKKKMGESFDDIAVKLKTYVEIRTPRAQKMFKTKLFWISLATNLVTVALSCVALNWLHPKLAKFIDRLRGKTPSTEKKVEVSR